MYQYTSTTIVNSADVILSKEISDKKSLFRVKFGPELIVEDDKSKITAVYKNSYSEGKPATAVIDLGNEAINTDGTGIYRVAIYVRLSPHSNEANYSNVWVFKGKPVYIEFDVNKAKKGKLAEYAARIAKKFQLATYGNDILEITGEGNTLTIKGKDQYQQFLTQDSLPGINVQKLSEAKYATPERFEDVIDWEYDENAKKYTNELVTTFEQGVEGFGDYDHMLRSYVYPTAQNTRWNGIHEDERPLVNGKYTQYTVYFQAKRGIMGLGAVGMLANSKTTHVFMVEEGATAKFEEELAKVLNDVTIEDVTPGQTEVAAASVDAD